MTKRYNWDKLEREGQRLWLPGVRPQQVSKLVKANVRRRLGPRAVVITAYVAETNSTYVGLIYNPEDVEKPTARSEDPATQPTTRKPLLPKVDPSEHEPDPFESSDDADDTMSYGDDS